MRFSARRGIITGQVGAIFVVFIAAMTLLMLEQVAQADITTGLIAHWQMGDKTGSTIPDASGNGHTLSINGAPTFAPVDVPFGTRQGDMVVFNDNGTMQTPDANDLDLLGSWTTSFWVREDANTPYGGNPTNLWMGKVRGFHDTEGGWFLNSSDNTRAEATIYGSPNVSHLTSERLPLGQWTRLTTTFDSTTDTLTIYYDDDNPAGPVIKHQTVGVSWTMLANTYPLYIGGNMEENQTLLPLAEGAMADIRIFDRALPYADMAQLVPEPATLSLLLFGGIMSLRRRR